MMDKESIRRRVKARKQLLIETERTQAAESVFRRLEQLAAFHVSDKILMYHSLPDELSTHAFLDKWHDNKQFFLPRVNGVNLEILPYERTSLKVGAFHIEEPSGCEINDVAEIDMIVVPAIAFDRKGNRVGRGKGYYDRLLAESKAMKIGVGYDFQLVDEIDTEVHDIPVDIVITETSTIILRHKR